MDRTVNRLPNSYKGNHHKIVKDNNEWYLCGCNSLIESMNKRIGKFGVARFRPRPERKD